jgi:DNA polymerase-3 subunit epsilon
MHLPFQLDRPLVFFDIETTGLSPVNDRIIELALIRLSPQGDVLERVRRFNPGMPISPEAVGVHGITDADVADEAPFHRRARALAALLEDCDLAGFNIRRFDLPFLVAEFQRSRVPFDAHGRRLIDMQQIFHREEPRDLSAAAKFYLDREHEEAHSALGDIRTSAAVLAAQFDRYRHLPRDLDGLHAYCDEVGRFLTEAERWFGIEDGRRIFRRGKHRGRFLEDVAKNEADYLHWMLGADDMSPDVLEIVREALSSPRSEDLAADEGPPLA